MQAKIRILALDVGAKRTGIALAFLPEDFIISLDTLICNDEKEWLFLIQGIMKERSVTHLAVGLPLLPSGEKGEQALYTEGRIHQLQALMSQLPIEWIDERYSSYNGIQGNLDAKAAVVIAEITLKHHRDKKNAKIDLTK